MLKHEPQEPAAQSAVPTAAQVRVTPEELNAALTALEADKQQAARLLAGTMPIGEIVDELHLDATPEQIWAWSVTVSGDVDTLRGDAPQIYRQGGGLDNAKWTSAP